MSMTTCVARGAALLDEVRPEWAGEIDTSVLDMQSIGLCILGQLWDGGYNVGVEALGLVPCSRDDVEHGFESGKPGFERAADYERLAEAWRAEIARRC